MLKATRHTALELIIRADPNLPNMGLKGGNHRPLLMLLAVVLLKIPSQNTTWCRSLGQTHRAS